MLSSERFLSCKSERMEDERTKSTKIARAKSSNHCVPSLSYSFFRLLCSPLCALVALCIVITFSNDVIFNAFKACANSVYRMRVIPVVMVAQNLISLSLCFTLTCASRHFVSFRFSVLFTHRSPVNTPVHIDCRLSIVNPTIAHCRIDEHSTYFTMVIHNHKSIKSHWQSAMDIFAWMEWCILGCEVDKKGRN